MDCMLARRIGWKEGVKHDKGRVQSKDKRNRGGSRMVKIRISYENEKELSKVLKLLSPIAKSWTLAKNNAGRFKKAYIEMMDNDGAKDS